MIFLYFLLILFFSFVLVKATDILIINFKSLSARSKISKFALTGLVLGLATSLPELFVGLSSAFEGKTILSLGNIIGANIANLSLVIGGAALISGAVMVRGDFIRRDVFYAFLAATAPMVLLFDKTLSRIDGLILLFLYIFYQIVIFSEKRYKQVGKNNQASMTVRLIRKLNQQKVKRELAWILLGIILLLFSADILVRVSIQMALIFNFPLLLVGLLMVSLGTTLPELVFSIRALNNKQQTMVFGNLLGSIVANGTLVIGLATLISPLTIQSLPNYLMATMSFVLIFGIFYLFIKTKHRLDRWEGLLLFIIYILFIFTQILKS